MASGAADAGASDADDRENNHNNSMSAGRMLRPEELHQAHLPPGLRFYSRRNLLYELEPDVAYPMAFDLGKGKTFSHVPGPQAYIDVMRSLPLEHRCGYEIVHPQAPCRMYLDIEKEVDYDPETRPFDSLRAEFREDLNELLRAFEARIRDIFGIEPRFIVLEACRRRKKNTRFKGSFHVIVRNLVFQNNKAPTVVLGQPDAVSGSNSNKDRCLAMTALFTGLPPTSRHGLLPDPVPYGKFQNFRLPYGIKRGEPEGALLPLLDVSHCAGEDDAALAAILTAPPEPGALVVRDTRRFPLLFPTDPRQNVLQNKRARPDENDDGDDSEFGQAAKRRRHAEERRAKKQKRLAAQQQQLLQQHHQHQQGSSNSNILIAYEQQEILAAAQSLLLTAGDQSSVATELVSLDDEEQGKLKILCHNTPTIKRLCVSRLPYWRELHERNHGVLFLCVTSPASYSVKFHCFANECKQRDRLIGDIKRDTASATWIPCPIARMQQPLAIKPLPKRLPPAPAQQVLGPCALLPVIHEHQNSEDEDHDPMVLEPCSSTQPQRKMVDVEDSTAVMQEEDSTAARQEEGSTAARQEEGSTAARQSAVVTQNMETDEDEALLAQLEAGQTITTSAPDDERNTITANASSDDEEDHDSTFTEPPQSPARSTVSEAATNNNNRDNDCGASQTSVGSLYERTFEEIENDDKVDADFQIYDDEDETILLRSAGNISRMPRRGTVQYKELCAREIMLMGPPSKVDSREAREVIALFLRADATDAHGALREWCRRCPDYIDLFFVNSGRCNNAAVLNTTRNLNKKRTPDEEEQAQADARRLAELVEEQASQCIFTAGFIRPYTGSKCPLQELHKLRLRNPVLHFMDTYDEALHASEFTRPLPSIIKRKLREQKKTMLAEGIATSGLATPSQLHPTDDASDTLSICEGGGDTEANEATVEERAASNLLSYIDTRRTKWSALLRAFKMLYPSAKHVVLDFVSSVYEGEYPSYDFGRFPTLDTVWENQEGVDPLHLRRWVHMTHACNFRFLTQILPNMFGHQVKGYQLNADRTLLKVWLDTIPYQWEIFSLAQGKVISTKEIANARLCIKPPSSIFHGNRVDVSLAQYLFSTTDIFNRVRYDPEIKLYRGYTPANGYWRALRDDNEAASIVMDVVKQNLMPYYYLQRFRENARCFRKDPHSKVDGNVIMHKPLVPSSFSVLNLIRLYSEVVRNGRDALCMLKTLITFRFKDRPELLCFDNGVVDLRTGQLLGPAKPDMGITKAVPHPFDPNADTSMFEAFIHSIFPPACYEDSQEIIDFYQIWRGYSVTGFNDLAKCLFCTGRGKNGKSVFNTLDRMTFGTELYTSMSMNALRQEEGGNNDALYRARFHRMVGISEMNNDRHVNEQVFKMITGGDPLDVKAKYKEEESVIFICKMTCFVNDMPLFSQQENFTLRRRIWNIPLRAQFLTEAERNSSLAKSLKDQDREHWIFPADPSLNQRLHFMVPGYIRWVVEGAKKYCMTKDQEISLPPTLLVASENDEKPMTELFEVFLTDNIIPLGNGDIPLSNYENQISTDEMIDVFLLQEKIIDLSDKDKMNLQRKTKEVLIESVATSPQFAKVKHARFNYPIKKGSNTNTRKKMGYSGITWRPGQVAPFVNMIRETYINDKRSPILDE